ncbi:MAG: hypothetical protein M3R45_12450 [Pseudomonadota bacterium]|nr:hypothetical protein [Pseudomonadota bacterium]
MAIGWLTVLQSVPWAEVVSNAPKVAAGAKKLWSAVGKKTPPAADPVAATPATVSPEAQTLAALQSRIAALEAASADLQGQMIAYSGLIKELAEQNAQLIVRIETQRQRLGWLAGLLLVIGLVAVGSLAWSLMG